MTHRHVSPPPDTAAEAAMRGRHAEAAAGQHTSAARPKPGSLERQEAPAGLPVAGAPEQLPAAAPLRRSKRPGQPLERGFHEPGDSRAAAGAGLPAGSPAGPGADAAGASADSGEVSGRAPKWARLQQGTPHRHHHQQQQSASVPPVLLPPVCPDRMAQLHEVDTSSALLARPAHQPTEGELFVPGNRH